MHPALSKVRCHPAWQRLTHRGYQEFFYGGCGLFSAGLGVVVALASPAACGPSSPFARLEQSGLQASAPALSRCFAELLLGLQPVAPPAHGLEGILLNDVMLSGVWQTDSAWSWRDKAHINVLEARAFLRALRLRALSCDDQRFVHGLDSHVALGVYDFSYLTCRISCVALFYGALIFT